MADSVTRLVTRARREATAARRRAAPEVDLTEALGDLILASPHYLELIARLRRAIEPRRSEPLLASLDWSLSTATLLMNGTPAHLSHFARAAAMIERQQIVGG